MDKIISFDIWDTILKRKCHPEETKLHTCKYIFIKYNNLLKNDYKNIYKILKERNKIEEEISNKNIKLGKDGEYKISDVFNMLLSRIFKLPSTITDELVNEEICKEKSVIYLNPDILPIFEKYKDYKKYCISDFYFGNAHLKELLDSVNVPVKFEKIYSSCDYLLNKRSGNLYKLVEEELKITPENHIHVGDNPYVDIDVANSLGISTIKIDNTSHFDFTCAEKRPFNFNLNSILKNSENMENKLYNIGVTLSPLLYFFVHKIIEHTTINNIEKVFYCTREGETFIKIHKLIQSSSLYTSKISNCEILEVSRMATFSPSLNEFTISELLRLWSQYRSQNLIALFKTLDIDINKYLKYINKYNIDIEEFIDLPFFDFSVQELLNDADFLKEINSELSTKRAELIKYISNLNIFNDTTPLFIVDIGWRGTIQDNLAHIFKNKEISGYYYTLFDFYNLQPKNTHKKSFITNKKTVLEDVAPMITLLEMLFNPESGSVVRYKDGQALRKVKPTESNLVKNYTSHIQEGLFAGAKLINEYLETHPYLSDEFEDYICNIIHRTKTSPPKDLIEIYYKLVHNDTFGTGNYVYKKMKLSWLTKINIFKTRNLLLKEEWREAFMIHNNIHILKYILNFKSLLRKTLKRSN